MLDGAYLSAQREFSANSFPDPGWRLGCCFCVDVVAAAAVAAVFVYGFDVADFLVVYGLDTAAEVVDDDLAYGLVTDVDVAVDVAALAYGFETGVFFAYGFDGTADGLAVTVTSSSFLITSSVVTDIATAAVDVVAAAAPPPPLCILRASNSNRSPSDNVDLFHSLKYMTNP